MTGITQEMLYSTKRRQIVNSLYPDITLALQYGRVERFICTGLSSMRGEVISVDTVWCEGHVSLYTGSPWNVGKSSKLISYSFFLNRCYIKTTSIFLSKLFSYFSAVGSTLKFSVTRSANSVFQKTTFEKVSIGK